MLGRSLRMTLAPCPALVLVAWTCAAAIGCRDAKPDSDGEPRVMHADERVATSAPPRAPGASVAPPTLIERADARALLEAWLETQNEGDFERYQSLYAGDFTGVKRTGALRRTYDRAGWMVDRGIMFGSPMTVTATEIDIQTSVNAAVIRFTQSWAAGDFKDVGPKLLVITRERDDAPRSGQPELRIAREEMLYSTVLSRSRVSRDLSPERFAFVLTIGAHAYLVIEPEPDLSWGRGAPALIHKDRFFVAQRALDEAALSPELMALRGQRFYLDGQPGCAATVDELMLLGGSVPHVGMLQTWIGGGVAPGYPAQPIDDAGLAAELWPMSEPILAARLLRPPDCEGVWAYHSGVDPAPRALTEVPVSAEMTASVLAEFRTLSGYRDIASRFERAGHHGRWEQFQGAVPIVRGFTTGDHSRTLVIASASAGGHCGRWRGDLWAVWDITPNQTHTLITPAGVSAQFVPDGAIDFAGDGIVEIVGHGPGGAWDRLLMQLVDGEYRAVERFSWPDFGSTCRAPASAVHAPGRAPAGASQRVGGS